MSAEASVIIERNSAEAEAVFASAPESLRAELLRGVVCMAPAPAPKHQLWVVNLLQKLVPYDRRNGGPRDPRGWVFLNDPELHLGTRPDKLRPDIAAWREGRWRVDENATAITVAPDWVCEVLSPSTETIDRGIKLPLYAEHGVQWAWLVDPSTGVIEVFENTRGAMRAVHTLRAGESAGLVPFERVEMRADAGG